MRHVQEGLSDLVPKTGRLNQLHRLAEQRAYNTDSSSSASSSSVARSSRASFVCWKYMRNFEKSIDAAEAPVIHEVYLPSSSFCCSVWKMSLCAAGPLFDDQIQSPRSARRDAPQVTSAASSFSSSCSTCNLIQSCPFQRPKNTVPAASCSW